MKHTGLFAAGVLFGTAGLKILGSKDARKVYAHTTAAVLRAKDSVMQTVTAIREGAEDVYADAKEINRLRAEADNTAKVLQDANRKVSDLESELAACRNRKPEVVKDTIDNSKKLLESVITFRQGRIGIDNSQLPNVERIATYLRNHKEAGVVIKGYASPEGSAEVNERIARQRAEAVRNMLVNRYRIAKDRIVAEGQGVGYMFEEPDWNRVSICTINTRPDAAEGK